MVIYTGSDCSITWRADMEETNVQWVVLNANIVSGGHSQWRTSWHIEGRKKTGDPCVIELADGRFVVHPINHTFDWTKKLRDGPIFDTFEEACAVAPFLVRIEVGHGDY